MAHKLETELLHQQCGIQDQIAAAFWGINFIEMDRYPHANVNRVILPKATEDELEARLALIYVGQSHSSSRIHERVIRETARWRTGCGGFGTTPGYGGEIA